VTPGGRVLPPRSLSIPCPPIPWSPVLPPPAPVDLAMLPPLHRGLGVTPADLATTLLGPKQKMIRRPRTKPRHRSGLSGRRQAAEKEGWHEASTAASSSFSSSPSPNQTEPPQASSHNRECSSPTPAELPWVNTSGSPTTICSFFPVLLFVRSHVDDA